MKKANFCYAVLAASAVLALGSAITSFAAAGWQAQGDEWTYVQNNGEYVKDDWRQVDGKYYYFGSDGIMLRNTLLNDNENYYYLRSSGEMITNEWRFIQNPEWQGDELVDEGSWYYFGSNGRAYVTKDNKAYIADIEGKKYAFDQYGRMITGWITENGEWIQEEENWSSGMYYADIEGGGSLVTNAWVYMTVPDDSNEDDTEPTYHFYFASNGKKTVSTDKTIADKKYHFDERGVAIYGWHQDEEDQSWKFYGDYDDPSLHTAWFQATPDAAMNQSGHDDGSTYWYYASSNGKIASGEFKTIDSKTYAFNLRGELITGLKIITTEEDNNKALASNPASVDYIANADEISDPNTHVFYFNSDGSLKTGTQTVTIDGSSYTFNFKSNGTPKGMGVTGPSDGYLYKNGRRLAAENGMKYGIVEYDDKEYVVNESGSLQKKKKNLKDADGYYYCTDKDGILIHQLNDKCEEKH